MNSISSLCLGCCFILLGINRVLTIKRNTLSLYEAVRFINMVKNNIRFSSMNYDDLIECGKKEKFSFINFSNGVSLSEYASEKARREFMGFVNKIGTTDSVGQLSLCDEYIERFKGFYNESAGNEKGKVNIVISISVLSVVCVLILGG
ncbi:MAG: hypothetical protein IJN49_02805 [Clostridia bacterium]|nr:hypothetical protein [Clostridia bacterium]